MCMPSASSADLSISPESAPVCFRFQGEELQPFERSRRAYFMQQRLAMGAPSLEACLMDMDAFVGDAWRILWLCSHDPADYYQLAGKPADVQLLIDRWADGFNEASPLSVAVLGCEILASHHRAIVEPAAAH